MFCHSMETSSSDKQVEVAGQPAGLGFEHDEVDNVPYLEATLLDWGFGAVSGGRANRGMCRVLTVTPSVRNGCCM